MYRGVDLPTTARELVLAMSDGTREIWRAGTACAPAVAWGKPVKVTEPDSATNAGQYSHGRRNSKETTNTNRKTFSAPRTPPAGIKSAVVRGGSGP